MNAPPQSASFLQRHPSYHALWLAKTGSDLGDWFNQVALAAATLSLTGSASTMGLVLLCRALPNVLLGPLASPLVDRLAKRPILYISDLVRAAFALSFAVAWLTHWVWLLYAGALLIGISGVLFAPARQAVLPLLVPREDLAEANAFESATSGVIGIFGALLGGVLSATVSPVICFTINALSYLWSAACLARAKWTEPQTAATDAIIRPSYGTMLREGFQEAGRNKRARAIILVGISWGLAGGGYYVMLPLLGSHVYHLGGLGIGLLYAIDGLGVLIGSQLVKRYIGRQHTRAMTWYGIAYLTQALFLALLAQSTWLLVGGLMLLFMRISGGIIIPLDSYLLQTSTEPAKLGRIAALHISTYGGVMQISYALVGFAFDRWGLPLVGLCIGCVSLACGLYWLAAKK